MSHLEGGAATHKPSPEPFTLAARFLSEAAAGRVYFRAQETIFKAPESSLSVYRFQLSRIYHVATVGESPPNSLEQRLRRIFSAGEFVTLPDNVLSLLMARRAVASALGGWAEGHYRPGMPL